MDGPLPAERPDLGPCWVWTGHTERGYGRYGHRAGSRQAHRLVYEEQVGPVPEGLELDHLCRVRHCVNPAHLEAVTHQENVLRGAGLAAEQARRDTCVNGHEFTEENTYWYANGRKRRCRECKRLRERK